MKSTVAIVGIGLIGGSLGKALKRTGKYHVIGFGRRRSTGQTAMRLGAVDEFVMDPSAIAAATIVVLCTPVAALIPMARTILPFMKAGTWLTDAGSVKKSIVAELTPLANSYGVRYIGSHPLAGSHKTGVESSMGDLFRGATCVIVDEDRRSPSPIVKLWKDAGAKIVHMSAAAHDGALALTSHLPHLIAHALVLTVMRRANANALQKLMAGSFRDVTRVASSDADQWAQIVSMNRHEVRKSISAFICELQRINAQLGQRRLKNLLGKSQRFRKPLFQSSVS